MEPMPGRVRRVPDGQDRHFLPPHTDQADAKTESTLSDDRTRPVHSRQLSGTSATAVAGCRAAPNQPTVERLIDVADIWADKAPYQGSRGSHCRPLLLPPIPGPGSAVRLCRPPPAASATDARPPRGAVLTLNPRADTSGRSSRTPADVRASG